MDFDEALKSFICNGYVSWNGYEISNKFSNKLKTEEKRTEIIDKIFTTITGSALPTAKLYVYAQSSYAKETPDNDLGCPLICHDSFSDFKEEQLNSSDSHVTAALEFQNLLSLNKAHHFLSYLSCHVNSKSKTASDAHSIFPALIFCDGHVNRRNIYAFYVAIAGNSNQTPVKEKREQTTPPITVTAIACVGPLPQKVWKKSSSDDESKDTCAYSMKELATRLTFQPHMLGIDGGLPPASLLSMDSFSQFQIFSESGALEQSVDINQQLASITVDIVCDEVTDFLEFLPQHVKTVSLNICPVPGDIYSPVYSMYKDVLILEGLLKAFGRENVVKWVEPEIDIDKDDYNDTKDVTTKVLDVIAFFNGNNVFNVKQTQSDTEKTEDNEDEVLSLIVPRNELDFTEKLWDVLKSVQSFQELLNGLEIVLKEIEAGRATRFWLHESSDSLLASLIKKSYQESVTIPKLSGLLPVQMLVEIGIEKLKRDYINFYFTHHLSTANRIEKFMAPKPDSSIAVKLQDRVLGIKKLHHVVELASYCYTILKLPMAKIDKLVRSTLQAYLTDEINYTKMFTFPVSYNEVKAFLENSHPNLWRISAFGKNENGEAKSFACWSRNFPFDGLINNPEVLTNTSLETSLIDPMSDTYEYEYYLTTVTESVLIAL